MRSDHVQPSADPEVPGGGTLLDRLREYLPDGRRITGLRRLGDGHSNDTYLLEGLDLILRAPPAGPGLMPDYDVARQYRIMRAVADTAGAPPVPAVRDLCTDTGVIGRPFFLMQRCAGESTDWRPPAWLREAPDDFRQRLSRTWIGAVASVHRMPVATFREPARTPAGEAAVWLELARRSDAPRRLLEVLEDLAADPPPTSGPPTCVHGDVKFANLLWTPDGTLTALLDWEFAAVGDPMTDLGYLLGLWPAEDDEPGQMPYTKLGGWWTRERFIAEWESLTGREAVAVRRYEALGMAKIGAIFALGLALHRSGANTDPRLARWDRSLEVWLQSMDRRAARPERAR